MSVPANALLIVDRERGPMRTGGMGQVARGVVLMVLAALAAACAVTPEERAAAQQAWAERDRDRRAECARQGLGFLDGACLSRGGP